VPEGPVLLPAGVGWTATATGPLAAGDPVEVSGSGTVARAGEASVSFVGIAAHTCPGGGLLTVLLGNPVLVSVAGSDITAGELIMADAPPGQVASTLAPRTRVYPPPARAAGLAPAPTIYDPDVKAYPPTAAALGAAPPPAMYERVRVYPPPAVALGGAPPPQFIRPLLAVALASAPQPQIWVVALPALDIAAAAAPPPDDIPGIRVFPEPAWAAATTPRPAGSADPYPHPAPALAAAAAPNPTVEGADVTVQLTTPTRFSLAAVPAVTIIPSNPATVTPDQAETTAVTGQATALAVYPADAAPAVTTAVPGQARVTGLAPTVISVTPNSGLPTTQQVTVRGTWFTSESVVEFGPPAGPRYQCSPFFTFVDSPTQIRCYIPSGPASGTNCTCWVTTENGTGFLADAFLCTSDGNPPPTVTSVTPNAGAVGTPVTIDGSGFFTAALSLIMFGGEPGSETGLGTASRKYCNAPPGQPGSCDVSVQTPAGTGTLENAFTYPGGPAVTAVTPNAGAAGLEVSITGTGFGNPAVVRVGGFPASDVTVLTSVQIICTIPAGPSAGSADVAVTADEATAVLRDGFTYTGAARAAVPAPRMDGDPALLGVALTSCAEGETVLWLARRPRYPWAPALPPAPVPFVPAPPPHGPVKTSHTHPHDHGWGPHDHPHAHFGGDTHDEGPGHPHDLRSGQ
jgi:IPT/TIG domain